MAKRKGLSKKIRFEVFKRDKFTCQYCGRKSPDVILNCDHIDPVAKGGTNEITNLITSCFDCNSGKSDRKLDDDTVVAKQRKQLEEIQERREQIELMLKWKKSLDTLDSDVGEMISEYVESRIKPFTLSEKGTLGLENHIKKFGVNDLLNGIDVGLEKYLKYNSGGELEQSSVETFLDKLGGIIAIQNMPPIKQKLAYIKGIARNRFNYWDNRKGSIILSHYVQALEDYGWSEEKILEDLETEVIKISKESNNWSEWRRVLEKWTQDIRGWEKSQSTNQVQSMEFSFEDLERHAYMTQCEISDNIGTILYIADIFEGFNKEEFIHKIISSISKFLIEENDFERDKEKDEIVFEFMEREGFNQYFDYSKGDESKFGIRIKISSIIDELITEIFGSIHYPSKRYSRKDCEILMRNHIEKFKTTPNKA
ncbi:HNH endonuclease [Neolewinella aurantiaca]|uniref:HNH endonuclease n=1 Tax=Neolewinella aurantiaca TaxID=2602767 RepID=A0A5C7FSL7_9BACT|nr:HNH endonuclease [Neolewinella aurantiaca]TXF91048.1 HNH endonuclease [Neolewinella aurantiaca]